MEDAVFKIKAIDGKGNGLVAIRDLDPGEVVFVEEAAAVGPASPTSCLECLKLTNSFCPRCKFSLCPDCQHLESTDMIRHDQQECCVLKKIRTVLTPEFQGLFNVVFPLRMARLKLTNSKMFEQLMSLEGHLQSRLELDNACTKSLVAIAEVVAKVVPEVGGLDEARRIVAIQITNGFEVNLPSMCGRGIYANTSFLNHSCIPNVTHSHRVKLANHNNNNSEKDSTKSPRFFLELKIQRAVQSGTELTIRYNSVFDGFVNRKRSFNQEWFFDCQCQRCQDPTEFRTFTSSVKCFQCRQGFVIPFPSLSSDLHLDILEQDPRFQCSHCQQLCKFNFVEAVEADVNRHMQDDNPPIEQMVDLIKACSATLHPNHYVVMSLKDNFVFKTTNELAILELQEGIAKELLEYLQVLDPGNTWRKGQILGRLRSVITSIAKIKTEKKEFNSETLKASLMTIQNLSVAVEKYKSF